MKKILAKTLTILAATTAAISALPTPAKALSLGEALGIGAGVYLINQAVQNSNDRHRFVPPEQEYRRGLEDGFNFARYDNPRNSGDYDRGFTQGRERASAGWRSPFQR